MDRPPIVLIGCSGNALEIFEAVQRSYRVLAFLDDNRDLGGSGPDGVPVLPMHEIAAFPQAQALFLIGSERSVGRRAEIIARLGLPEARFATFVHPAATVSRFATLGAGCVVFAGVVITAGARVGRHVIILPNSVVHHDAELGDHCLVGSNVTLAGGCRLGAACYVGSASSVRNGVSVGAGSLIGMAANVVRDVGPGLVVAGNPARPMTRSG